MNNPKPKRHLYLMFTLMILVNSFGVSIGKPHITYAQQDPTSLSERYIIFLGGIRSTSLQDPKSDVYYSFEKIRNYLITNAGIKKEKIIYFSYSAINSPGVYCLGWGTDNCSNDPSTYLDLIKLSTTPTYTVKDTQQSVVKQAEILEWLIDQIVQKDPNAKIDLIGFSLGGIVSSYWAANIGKSSPLKDHIHSIIILESPVGGIPGAEAFLNCGNDLRCKGWRNFFIGMWGETVLTQLQLEIPNMVVDGSIINELAQAPVCFQMTSIQSTTDYIVTGDPFPIFFGLGVGVSNSMPLGVGSQAWGLLNIPDSHLTQNLGGKSVSTPVPIGELIIKGVLGIDSVINKNHGAPLDQEQTAQWISEAIRAPFHAKNCSNISNAPTVISSTVMLFDVSGSMGEQDATGITKIDAAKNSGDRILDIIQAENSAFQGAEIGILSFSNGAWVNAYISSDVASARSALNGLYPLNGTGMPDGLRLAIDQLAGTQNAKPIIIMLSDGLPNIALGASGNYADPDLARQQSLDLASEAGSEGICVYTVGFGIPYTAGNISGEASIDEDFLKQVAANSGCGAYYNAQDATQLANVYVNLRHLSTGNILLSQTGNISQGQTVDIANVQVPDNQSMILFTLNWPGSQLDAILTDPSGTTVDSNYLNASFSMADTLASVIIQNPQPGDWKVAAKGVDVPEDTTTYNAVLSTRPNPNPPTEVPQEAPPATVPNTSGFQVVILILVVAGGGIAVYVLLQTKTKDRSKTTVAIVSAQLVCISGELTGQSLPLRDRLLVGRGSGSGLKLTDRTISRQHAIFRFSGGNWYIQDMNSKSGIFVNDARVNATVLRNGDRVRIGTNVFEFRVTG